MMIMCGWLAHSRSLTIYPRSAVCGLVEEVGKLEGRVGFSYLCFDGEAKKVMISPGSVAIHTGAGCRHRLNVQNLGNDVGIPNQ